MFNTRGVAVLAAAAGLWVTPMMTGTAQAAPAPAAAVQEDEVAAAMQEWVARTVVWSEGYSNLTSRRVETVGWLTDGPNALIVKLESPDKRRAREWVTAWAAEGRARLAAEMDAYRSLPTELPQPRDAASLSPQFRQRLDAMGRLADRTGSLMISTGQACEEYIQLMEAAASGRDEDLVRLDAGYYKLNIAHLQAENVMMQAFAENATSPALEFSMIQIEVNRAIIVWSQYLHDTYMGVGDGPEAAEQLRAHAREMQTLVANLRSRVNIIESNFRREPEMLTTPFGQTIMGVLASMHQSAAVEERVGVAIGELADAAQANDETAGQAVADRMSGLIEERLRLDASRREMLAGAQS